MRFTKEIQQVGDSPFVFRIGKKYIGEKKPKLVSAALLPAICALAICDMRDVLWSLHCWMLECAASPASLGVAAPVGLHGAAACSACAPLSVLAHAWPQRLSQGASRDF